MATGPFLVGSDSPGAKVWKWIDITNGGTPDTMNPLPIDAKDDLTVYVLGVLGGNSPSIAMHGSPLRGSVPDTTDFAPLSSGGTPIAIVAVQKCLTIDQGVLQIKPVLTGGDGSTLLSVWIVAK